jgi:transposase
MTMYLRQIKRPQGIYLAIQESYYDSEKKQSRTRNIRSLGYLDALKKEYADPVAHFEKVAEEMTAQKKEKKSRTLQIDTTAKLEIGTNNTRNVGYGIFKVLYKQLELDKFWNWKTRGRNMMFSTDQIFRLLTFSRVLHPGSKRYTLNNKDAFFEPFDGFTLDDIYHALDVIAENQEALQKWIFEHSAKLCKRDLSVTYFDCTNYYFDIGRPDIDNLDMDGNPVDKKGNAAPAKYRKYGPEKNHRPDPILAMGLLMDRNGIPVAYDLFPGNESEKVHMRPIIDRIKNEFDDCRIIFVADRGLNTSDNIYWLNGNNKGEKNKRDGYVYGQSVRGADAEFKKWVLSGNYLIDKLDENEEEEGEEDEKKNTFTHKSRIYPKELHVNVTKPGSKKTSKKLVRVDQKQMVYYSEKYAKKQRRDREVMIARAKDLINYPKKYDRITSKGSASYVLNIAFDKKTGEIVEGKTLQLDMAKIEEEAQFDGYYSIVTSELNMSDLKMREIYRGLARIEDSFKVTKTYFQSRPVFVRTNKHIDAHFATCFMALVLLRLLEVKLENKFPVGQIIDSLRNYNCAKMNTNLWQFTFYNEIVAACGKSFGLELDKQYQSQQEIQRLLRY